MRVFSIITYYNKTTYYKMEKRYNHVKTNPSRFSFHEFCKMAWRMSAKEDWHYIDFKNHFDGELKALYLKTGEPLRVESFEPPIKPISVASYLSSCTPSRKGEQGAVFHTLRELGELLKVDRTELLQALTVHGFETNYFRETCSEYSKYGVWMITDDLPF